ncbi:uncharacterized protein LOC141737971 isoform X1 [Larus michahellis]|uniref:uncharacterized protein LOC141737971 isoform X1 n=1 Tax=Larus michahellis TaxID=119627 RepID=UPI003D9B8E35
MGSPGRPPPPPPPPPPPVPPVPPVRGGGRLRSLHWEPVPAWRVRGRRSVWAPPTPPPPPLDLPRLRLLFGESRGAAPGQRPTPAAALLEPKRSLAIGVFLKQVKRPVRQIVRDIQDGVGEPYGAEKLLELCRLLPGAAEVSRLRSFAGSPRQLPDAELFMLLLIEVPSYARRLELLVLQEEFFPRLSALRAAIQTLTAAAEELLECQELHILLHLILSAGNHLNSGGYAGSAAGFRLASLLKLPDTKANEPGMDLLHFVAMVSPGLAPPNLTPGRLTGGGDGGRTLGPRPEGFFPHGGPKQGRVPVRPLRLSPILGLPEVVPCPGSLLAPFLGGHWPPSPPSWVPPPALLPPTPPGNRGMPPERGWQPPAPVRALLPHPAGCAGGGGCFSQLRRGRSHAGAATGTHPSSTTPPHTHPRPWLLPLGLIPSGHRCHRPPPTPRSPPWLRGTVLSFLRVLVTLPRLWPGTRRRVPRAGPHPPRQMGGGWGGVSPLPSSPPRALGVPPGGRSLPLSPAGGGQDGEEPAGLPRQTAARGPGIADRRGGGGGGAAAAGGAAGGGAGRRGAGAAAAALRGGGRSGAAGGAGRAAADAPRRQRRPRLLLRGRGARRPARALRRPARLRHAPPRRRPGEPCAGAGAAPAAADGAGAAEASLGGHVLGAGRDPPGGHDGRPPPAHPPARPSRPPLPPPRPPPAPRGPHGAAPGGGLPPAPPGRPSRRAGGDLPAWPRAAPPGHRRGPPRPPAPLQPLPAAGGLRGAGDPPVAPPGLGPDGVPAAPGGGGGGPGPPQLRGCWARLLSPPVPIPAPPLCCDNKH